MIAVREGFCGAGFSLRFLGLCNIKIRSLNRTRKKYFLVIPSEASDLLFFRASKKQQIPRANIALGMTWCEFFRSL